jgi:hypothetical protein
LEGGEKRKEDKKEKKKRRKQDDRSRGPVRKTKGYSPKSLPLTL